MVFAVAATTFDSVALAAFAVVAPLAGSVPLADVVPVATAASVIFSAGVAALADSDTPISFSSVLTEADANYFYP